MIMEEKVIKSYMLNLIRQGFCVNSSARTIDPVLLTRMVIDDLELEEGNNVLIEQVTEIANAVSVPENVPLFVNI